VLVAGADAVVDEDAVVVGARDALLADGAVLGPGGLEEQAGGALDARAEEGEVVRVAGHFAGVVVGRDGAGVAEGGEVEEDVGERDGDGAEGFVDGGHEGPCCRQVEVFAYCEEEDEEYLG